jgi:ribosomal protein S18 acetylase RimI-like enzyme
MPIRPYAPTDWPRLCEIHDAARLQELAASGLLDAFLTLQQTAENEGLFDGQVLVAEEAQVVQGFIGFTDDELTWLYVDPKHQRRGVARQLVRAALKAASVPLVLDVLVGNDAALQFYLSEGFEVIDRLSGKLAGNESFAATADVLRSPVDTGQRHEGDPSVAHLLST